MTNPKKTARISQNRALFQKPWFSLYPLNMNSPIDPPCILFLLSNRLAHQNRRAFPCPGLRPTLSCGRSDHRKQRHHAGQLVAFFPVVNSLPACLDPQTIGKLLHVSLFQISFRNFRDCIFHSTPFVIYMFLISICRL